MKIFVADSGNLDRRQWCIDHDVGLLMSPEYGTLCKNPNADIMIDNGAFGAWKRHEDWNETAFYRFLNRQECSLYAVVCPDLVNGGIKSLEQSAQHYDRLNEFPLYLPIQKDIEIPDIKAHLREYPDYEGLFIGGGNSFWKWFNLPKFASFAHDNGLKCHAGMIGNVRGYMAARNLGCDSVDGSNLMRNNRLSEILRYRVIVEQQSHLLTKEEWFAQIDAATATDWRK